jgi:hypothetical protein
MLRPAPAAPVVLRRIVEAAQDLVGARYAALGVSSPIGGLAEFVHTGMPPEMVAAIGDLPQGNGLLGALIDDPRPIRLRHVTDDDRPSGFPAGHPPMSSFLGVPIRIRDYVFGNLYLAESTRGEFGAEDEELALALASTAAVAIENARLYEAARSRGQWLQAQAAITRQILAADEAGRPLQLIAEATLELARVELVTVVLPAGPEELCVDVAVGAGAQGLPGTRVARDGSLSGQVYSSGTPLRSTLPDSRAGFGPAIDIDLGPVLAVPSWARPACAACCGPRAGRDGRRSAPRNWTWPRVSPTRPRWRSSWPRPGSSSNGPSCSRNATGSRRTCTTM